MIVLSLIKTNGDIFFPGKKQQKILVLSPFSAINLTREYRVVARRALKNGFSVLYELSLFKTLLFCAAIVSTTLSL